ncbi:MAG: hypothetical protein MUF19_02610 [Candidatus Pacebacteria bacterium]|nr:hypothetical protein [Candidatus Paceibacterota bacterium]
MMDVRYWAVGAAILFLAVVGLMMLVSPGKKDEGQPKARASTSNVRPIRPVQQESADKRRRDNDDDGYVDGYIVGQLTGVPFGRIPGPRRHRDEDEDHPREDKGSTRDKDSDPADTDGDGGGDGGGGGGD